MEEMTIQTKQGQKTFLAIVEGGLDWACSEGAVLISFSTAEEADRIGFDKTDFERIDTLKVGQAITDFDYEGVHVMRIR